MERNLSEFIESVANPNGRFRTLDGIYARCGDDGQPLMTLTELTADFETVYNGCSYVLKCLPDVRVIDIKAMQALSVYTGSSRSDHLAPHIYMESEMLVFDMYDRPVYVDVILHAKPQGESLERFAASAARRSDSAALCRAVKGLTDMACWLAENDFSHRNINARNIRITGGGTAVMVNYIRGTRYRLGDDVRRVATLAAAIYLAACAPETYLKLLHERTLRSCNVMKLAAMMQDIVKAEDIAELGALLELLLSQGADSVEICAALRAAAETRPRSFGAVSDELASPKLREPFIGNPDPGEYLFVGDIHEGLIRVYDGTDWFYLDGKGDIRVRGPFASAGDFAAGRAAAEVASGYGVIDAHGNWVIAPQYDDIEWDGAHGVAIVTLEGQSGLCDHDGKHLTGLIYDQILSGNEDIFPVRKFGRYGYISKDGTMMIRPHFEDAFGFRNGVARVRERNREVLIDRGGGVVEVIAHHNVAEPVGGQK